MDSLVYLVVKHIALEYRDSGPDAKDMKAKADELKAMPEKSPFIE